MKRNWDAAWMLAAFALHTACADDGHPPPLEDYRGPEPKYEGCSAGAPCDILAADCQRHVFEVSQCIWDGASAVQPEVLVLDEEQTLDYLTQLVEAIDNPDEEQFLAIQQGMQLLGFQETVRTVNESLATEVAGLLALYSPRNEEIVIIDRGEPTDDEAANAVLVHEFVHALQDQAFDFDASAAGLQDTDATLAYRAVVEGDATLHEFIVQALFSRASVTPARMERVLGSIVAQIDEDALAEDIPVEALTGVFPYLHGGLYMARILNEEGRDGTKAAFADVGQPTRNILFASLGDRVNARSFETSVPFEPLPDHDPIAVDRLGAWYAFLFAARNDGSVDPARNISVGLADDRLFFFSDAMGSIAVVWRLEWSTGEQAEAFASLVASPDGAAWAVEQSGTEVVVTATGSEASTRAWAEHLAGPPIAARAHFEVPAPRLATQRAAAWIGRRAVMRSVVRVRAGASGRSPENAR